MADLTSSVKNEQARSRALRRWMVLGCLAIAAVGGFFALKGCEDEVGRDVQTVKVGGQWFHLEIADTDKVRMKGLGQRTYIAPDGGMLFVFTNPMNPSGGGFVMRDCPIDIDIIYLDGSGRVGNWHAMKGDPRKPDEGTVGETGYNDKGEKVTVSEGAQRYEDRLHRYEPRYAYQFAIELAGGTIEGKLKGKIKEGDKIDLPLEALKKRAK